MDPVQPSVGWGVLHLFYRVDRARAEADPNAGKRIVDAVQSLVDDGHQALLFAVLGHKADLGVMALGPDLARLQAFQHDLAGTPLDAGRLVRLAHRALGVHLDRGRRAGPARRRGAGRGPRSRSPARGVARAHGALPGAAHPPAAPAQADDLLLPDVEAAHGRRQLVRAPVRGAEAAHGRSRARRAHLRGAGAAAHHRFHRARRLGVGRHVARRRPGRAQGDRLRDAVRSGVGRLRGVRAVRDRVAARTVRGAAARRALAEVRRSRPCRSTFACSCRSPRNWSTAR